jgi:membrane-associated phospholipid phosphatase
VLGRVLLVAFYLWMCFSAAYLDHHWILDLVAGSAYALVVGAAIRVIARRAASKVIVAGEGVSQSQ